MKKEIKNVINRFPKYETAVDWYPQLVNVMPSINFEPNYITPDVMNTKKTIMAANGISNKMYGRTMFVPHLVAGTDEIVYSGYGAYGECGLFTEEEALACSLVMIHGTFGMMELTPEDGGIITALKHCDRKYHQLLD